MDINGQWVSKSKNHQMTAGLRLKRQIGTTYIELVREHKADDEPGKSKEILKSQV